MKSKLQSFRLFPLTLACLSLAAPAALADSAVVRGDFNQDGNDDVFAVRSGRYFLRPDAAEPGRPVQEMTFLTPPLFLAPDTVKVADLDQDGFSDMLLASRSANRLLILYGQAILTEPFRTDEFLLPGGPVGADAAQCVATEALEILAVLHALPQPVVAMLDAEGSVIANYPLPSEAGSWSPLGVAAARLLVSEPLPQFAWLTRDSTGAEQIWWAEFLAASPGAPPVATTNLLSLGTLSAENEPGAFAVPRLAHGQLLGSREDGYWVVLPLNTNVLAIAPANGSPEAAPVAYRESLGFVGQGGGVISDAAGDLVIVVAADGTFARIFRWEGPGRLVTVEDIPAPVDHALLHALPLSDGNLFLALRGSEESPGSWTTFAHYDRMSAMKGYTYIESFPHKAGTEVVARVVVFDRDPFGGDALEWESFALGGWALNAAVQNGNVLVDFQTDPGVPGGLGEQTQVSLLPRLALPPAAVALANQWEPDSSLFFAGPPALAGGAGVSPQPPPGSYGSEVNLSFTAALDVAVRFRLGNGPWQAGRGPVRLRTSTMVEFYGVTEGGQAGPIDRGFYAVGEPEAPLPGSLREDSDQNGLEDSWERLFYGQIGVDPNGDSDNDEFTNRQEYEAGTNPRDALSRPSGSPGSDRRIIASVAPDGRFRFRLETDLGTDVIAEYSEDLLNWFQLPGMPQTLPDGSREWTDPDPPAGARFYRLSRP